jgi:NDP-sugar pyrophosphorylase family protein
MTGLQAVVLAGGKGTRLRPYTTNFPKPLMPVGGVPILEILLRQLRDCGVSDVILTTGHLAYLIEGYFGHGSPCPVTILTSDPEDLKAPCGRGATVIKI